MTRRGATNSWRSPIWRRSVTECLQSIEVASCACKVAPQLIPTPLPRAYSPHPPPHAGKHSFGCGRSWRISLFVTTTMVAQANSMKRMRHHPRSRIARMPAAAVGLFALAVCASSHGFADPSVPLGAGAQKSLEIGISAYQDGALEVAVEALSDALLQGDLSQPQTAEAFYYRGLAFRELGRPGQAITDLTAAMSVKGGLSKAHLKEAMRNRAGAYREAGLTATETAVAPQSGEGSRIAVQLPANRLPVPASADEDQSRQPDPPPTTSSISGQAPPASEGDFVSAIEKLIPNWP